MTEYLSKTYALSEDSNGGLAVCGLVDGMEALRQTVGLMLQVESGEYAIFSDGYGLKVSDLAGEPYPKVVAELERRIKDALLSDDRILAVEDFSFTAKANRLSVGFTVKSIYGEDSISAEVAV